MGDKLPQPTATLIKRLRRVAKHLDRMLAEDWIGTSDTPQWRARSNTCWQAAARLEELDAERIANNRQMDEDGI
jgi:hypothetical protein